MWLTVYVDQFCVQKLLFIYACGFMNVVLPDRYTLLLNVISLI